MDLCRTKVQVVQFSLLALSSCSIRVKLRRVTAASYLPEFKIGSQQNFSAQEGTEVAGEALEMLELRRGIKLNICFVSMAVLAAGITVRNALQRF